MAMGRSDAVQDDLMATWAEMPRSPRHAFYDRLQDQGWYQRGRQRGGDLDRRLEASLKADAQNFQIALEEAHFARQRKLRLRRRLERRTQQLAESRDDPANPAWIAVDER